MKLSKHASVAQETMTTPRKRKVDARDIVVDRAIRHRMEDMSIGGKEVENREAKFSGMAL